MYSRIAKSILQTNIGFLYNVWIFLMADTFLEVAITSFEPNCKAEEILDR